jgi:hypothetical protein
VTLQEDKANLAKAKDALVWVKGKLFKRRLRVAFTHRRKKYWVGKAQAAEREKRWANAKRAEGKVAYWREQEDKAILGRAEFNRRRKRIERKIKLLSVKVEKGNTLPASGVTTVNRPWNGLNRPIANWIVDDLDKIYANGCRFTVTSGYRSNEYQCTVCIGVCGNCGGCPGRCAPPGSSNHRGTAYPIGAVDVTNYYAVEAALARIGSPLHNSLGAQDPVHMSATGY